MNKKAQEIYKLYAQAVLELEKSNFQINACRCSNNLAQLLLEVDRGTYGYDYVGCLRNDEILKAFATYMANR